MKLRRKPPKEQKAARPSGIAGDIDAECLRGFQVDGRPDAIRLDVLEWDGPAVLPPQTARRMSGA
jgi:hypothetical protein